MELPKIPLDNWADSLVVFLRTNLRPVFRAISDGVDRMIAGFEDVLLFLPEWALIIIVALIAWKLTGRNMALFVIAGILLIISMELWLDTVRTLALILTAVTIALVIGIPLGIIASRNEIVWKILRPILDFMQTMPIFVYLLPAVMFFGIGLVPAVIATVVFAMPPAIRLTNLGIRQVPKEIVEAAISFGSTPMQTLRKVQLPLALPSIMAGVNQCIMLSLSMVVIAAMIGAGGLGGVVYRAVTRLEIGSGFEGGVAVVIIAIVLDRLTQSVGK